MGFLALVVAFTLPPLIRLACGEPPSPSGEGFGAGELGGCRGEPTWAAGACPRPTHGCTPFPKLLSRIEPGDPQRCGSTARVAVSNRQRRHAALPLPLGEVPSAHTGRRGPFSLTTTYNVAALSVGFAASSPRGRAKWGAVLSFSRNLRIAK